VGLQIGSINAGIGICISTPNSKYQDHHIEEYVARLPGHVSEDDDSNLGFAISSEKMRHLSRPLKDRLGSEGGGVYVWMWRRETVNSHILTEETVCWLESSTSLPFTPGMFISSATHVFLIYGFSR